MNFPSKGVWQEYDGLTPLSLARKWNDVKSHFSSCSTWKTIWWFHAWPFRFPYCDDCTIEQMTLIGGTSIVDWLWREPLYRYSNAIISFKRFHLIGETIILSFYWKNEAYPPIILNPSGRVWSLWWANCFIFLLKSGVRRFIASLPCYLNWNL